MIGQLRIYTINKGMMDGWLKLFWDEIAPRVSEVGIVVQSAWVDEEHEQFIWIRTFDDREDIEVKEATFYGSEWWNANVAHIRSHLARREITVIEPFLPDGATPQ